ncbi:MAG: tetratricopeptide repeat protein [Acidobacteria bacterium]|nr:tetratricopeptide repeat protein [Acidobacteriota bacterium]
MKTQAVLVFVTTLTLNCAGELAAQGRSGHTLFGDLKADESKAGGRVPHSYTVVLASVPWGQPRRQPVPNGGRYSFMDVPNGEYNLIVEVEGNEMVRIPLLLQESRFTDIRKDIILEWTPDAAARLGPALPFTYARSASNQSLFAQAQEALAREDYGIAASLFDHVVKKDPKDYEAWTELGTTRFNQEKLGDAERAYRSALALKPEFQPAQLNLGKVLMAQKDYERAIEALDLAVKSQPQSADAHYLLGESYLQVKKGSKAVVHLNEAIRLDPSGKADAHLRLAALYNAAGMKDRAAAEYEQFLPKRPDHPDRDKLRKYIEANKKR